MRTTLNLDEDVAEAVARAARRQGRSQSRVANQMIRAGFATLEERGTPEPYDPPVFDTGPPLVDVTDVAATLEVLDDAE